jgi:methyl-accepting chemotaxis protein
MNAADTPRRIATGFAVIVLLSLLLGLLAIWRIRELSDNATRIGENAVPSVLTLNDVIQTNFAALRAARAVASGGAMRGDGAEAAYRAAKAAGDAACIKYEKLFSDDEDQRLFTIARTRRDELMQKLDAVVAGVRQNRPEEAAALVRDEVDAVNEACTDAFNADVQYNDKLTKLELRRIGDNVNWSLGLIGAGLALAALLGGIVGWLTVGMTRRALASISDMIRDGVARTNQAIGAVAEAIQVNADQTAASASQLSSASQSLAHGCSEQTASVTETGASLEEMSAMIRSTAENAAKAKELANAARAAAEAGRRRMGDMEEAMRSIEASGLDVAKIVRNIDEIAFQTNILALNAAVEAARAGESGAGFAVVADEVRALAQRSAAAAKETADRIDAAITSTKRGAESCAGVGESLDAILTKVSATDELAAEIALGAREQSQGIQQVNTAMAQIDKVTQSNATGAEQTSSAVEELRGQAALLKENVSRLRRVMLDAERGTLVEAAAPHRLGEPLSRVPAGPRSSAADEGSFRAF